MDIDSAPPPTLPTFPPRRLQNLHQTYQHPLAPLPTFAFADPGQGSETSTDPGSDTDDTHLIPLPLFSKRKRRRIISAPLPLPLTTIHVAVFDISPICLSPSSTSSDASSRTASTGTSVHSRSRSSSISSVTSISSSACSACSSPSLPHVPCNCSTHTHAPSSRYPPVSPPWDSHFSIWNTVALSTPPRVLRRKRSPRRDTLRRLREQGSEAALQKRYEERTGRYLDGSLVGGWK